MDTGLEDDRWWWQLAMAGVWFSPAWVLLPAWTGFVVGAARGNWIAAALIICPVVLAFSACVYGAFCTGYSNECVNPKPLPEPTAAWWENVP